LLDDEEAVKKFFYASVEVPSLSELSPMDKEQVEKAIEKTHSTFLVSPSDLFSLTLF
jgi:pyruvate/2-oxoglutarate/acetoin dehydrogenase E1 component